MKIPYLAVVGPRDAEARKVSVRAFGVDRNLGEVALEDFVADIAAEAASRGATRLVSRFEEEAATE